MGFSHIHHPDHLKHTCSSTAAFLEQLPLWEQDTECTFQGIRGVVVRSLQLPWSSLRVTWQSSPLHDLPIIRCDFPALLLSLKDGHNTASDKIQKAVSVAKMQGSFATQQSCLIQSESFIS